MKERGFTLIEIMVASAIGAVVAVVAVATMQSVVAARDKCALIDSLNGEVNYVCELLKRDLQNLYRDRENGSLLESQMQESGDALFPSFRFFTIKRNKLRFDEPEGDVYQVHYFIKLDEETQKKTLMYRCAPVIAGLEEEEEMSSGGIMMPVSENVSQFEVSFYDDKQWHEEWVEDNGDLPELIEITFSCGADESRDIVSRNVLLNIPRLSGEVSADDSQQDVDENELLSGSKNEGAAFED